MFISPINNSRIILKSPNFTAKAGMGKIIYFEDIQRNQGLLKTPPVFEVAHAFKSPIAFSAPDTFEKPPVQKTEIKAPVVFRPEDVLETVKKTAIAVDMCEQTAAKRDKLADEADEIFRVLQFGEMLDYADDMDDENIKISSYYSPFGYTTSVGFYEDGRLISTAEYRKGTLREYKKLDGNGIFSDEYEVISSYYDLFDTSVHINKKEKDACGDTSLTLRIRNGRPASLAAKRRFFSDPEIKRNYDERIYFSRYDGRPIRYEEGFKLLYNGDIHIDKVLKENSFQIKYGQYEDGSEKADFKLVFSANDNGHIGKLLSYSSNFKIHPDDTKSADRRLVFNERGIANKYQINCTLNKKGKLLSGDEYSLADGKWGKAE